MHLYMGSNVEKTVNGKTVNVQMESDMPWEGNIKIRVQAENAKMTLALRIPGWCKNYKISGIEDAAQEEKDGYLYLKKVWNREETFCIDFPMEVQMFAASERVREDIGKAAIMRGPVVYCLEEKDNGKNLHEHQVLSQVLQLPEWNVLIRGQRLQYNQGRYVSHKE